MSLTLAIVLIYMAFYFGATLVALSKEGDEDEELEADGWLTYKSDF